MSPVEGMSLYDDDITKGMPNVNLMCAILREVRSREEQGESLETGLTSLRFTEGTVLINLK